MKAQILKLLLWSDVSKGNGKTFFQILPTIVTSEHYYSALRFCRNSLHIQWLAKQASSDVYVILVLVYLFKERKTLKKLTKSRDAVAKKNRYKRSRDK